MRYFDSIVCVSVAEAIKSDTPVIAALKKSQGEVFTKAVLVKYINHVVKFFNLGKSMDSSQVAQTVDLIMQQYYFLKLADFKLCFDNLKAGKYGKLFDRLDGQIILMAITEYCKERAAEAEKITLEAHKVVKEQGEKKYLLQDDKWYLREKDDEEAEWILKPELATLFTYERAWTLKSWLAKNGVVAEVVKPKPEQTLIEHIEQVKPEWLKEESGLELNRRAYDVKRAKIMADESLSDLEKYNKVRAISNMAPATQAEYDIVCEVANRRNK